MQTTSLYIEMIIIGAEVSTWILLIFAMIDTKVISFLRNGFSFVPSTIIFLCVCYVIGIVFDRYADWIFNKLEKKIRKKYIADNVISYKVWQKHEIQGQPYYEFTMSRKRIVRGTILNTLPITITLALYTLLQNFSIALVVAIIISGILVFFLCYKIHLKIINDYYKKVKRYMDFEKEKS